MAIDTANKRKSVLGRMSHYLLPIPDATIDSANRRQLCDFYALAPYARVGAFWVKDRDSSQTWVSNRVASNTWVQDRDASNTWKQDGSITE